MLDFYKTRGGRQFVDSTMHKVAVALEKIADSLETIASILEDEADKAEEAKNEKTTQLVK